MQSKFEAILLHKGNHLSLTHFAHAYELHKTYETMVLVLHLIEYSFYNWNICRDLKVIGLLLKVTNKLCLAPLLFVLLGQPR